MIINEILNRLQDKGVRKAVSTIALDDTIDMSHFVTDYIEDARSAVFAAYGTAKIDKNPVVIITEDAYLPNTYTGLTEAWFQRIPVIVIALNSDSMESSRYLERCVDSSFLVNSLSDIDEAINKIFLCSGPSLIKVKEQNKEDTIIDYSYILNCLESFSRFQSVICYNSKINSQRITDVDPQYKYGILSKYIGSLNGGAKSILCIPEELLGLDTNIFNIRNLPSNFRLVVKSTGSGHWGKMEKWISKNGIKTYVHSQKDERTKFDNELQQSPVAILVV